MVFIQGWRDPKTGAAVNIDLLGPVVRQRERTELLPQAVWSLLQAVRRLSTAQKEAPGEATNQIGWANIRKQAKKANAGMDGFLDKRCGSSHERLQLKPRKSMVGAPRSSSLKRPSTGSRPTGWRASMATSRCRIGTV